MGESTGDGAKESLYIKSVAPASFEISIYSFSARGDEERDKEKTKEGGDKDGDREFIGDGRKFMERNRSSCM